MPDFAMGAVFSFRATNVGTSIAARKVRAVGICAAVLLTVTAALGQDAGPTIDAAKGAPVGDLLNEGRRQAKRPHGRDDRAG